MSSRALAARVAGFCLLLACPVAVAAPLVTVDAVVEGWETAGISDLLTRILEARLQGTGAADLPGAVPVAVTVRATGPLLTTTTRPLDTPTPVIRSTAADLRLLAPVLLGDIQTLWADATPGGVPARNPSPIHLFTLQGGSLQLLLGEGAVIQDIAWGTEGLVLSTNRGSVTVDTLGRVIPATARDLDRRTEARPAVSRVLATRSGRRLELGADQRTVVLEDVATGARRSWTAPGSPWSGVTALGWGGFALWRNTPSAGATDLQLGFGRGDGVSTRAVSLPRSFVSAVTADADGNLWLFDAVERRLRVVDGWGREIHGLRPVIDRAVFALPGALAVWGEGDVLLAGEGAMRKVDATGMPVWDLSTLAPGRALPRSYRIALHGSTGLFTLLDTQTRELHFFSERSDTLTALEREIERHTRQGITGPEAAAWCLDNDLVLLAGQHLGPQRPGESQATVVQRRRLVSLAAEDLARATAETAARQAGAMDLGAAEKSYAAAADRYRDLRNADPARTELGAMAAALQEKRIDLRETLLGFLELDLEPTAPVLHGMLRPGEGALQLRVGRVAGRESTVEGVVAEISASELVRPAVVRVGDLVSGRELRLPVVLTPDTALLEEDRVVHVGIRLSGTIDGEVVRTAHTVDAVVSARQTPPLEAGRDARARHLAWMASAMDPAVRDAAADLRRRNGIETPPDPVTAAALVWNLLADGFRIEGGTPAREVRTPRQTLSAWAGTEGDALVLAASLLEGVTVGFLTAGDATYLILDTGLSAPDDPGWDPPILAGSPHHLLALAAPTAGSGALERAATRARDELADLSPERVTVAWRGPGGAPTRAPHLWTPLLARQDLAPMAYADAARVRGTLAR